MENDNPYASPNRNDVDESIVAPTELVPMTECPNCHASVTFWRECLRMSDIWFKCRHCRSRFRKHIGVKSLCLGFGIYLALVMGYLFAGWLIIVFVRFGPPFQVVALLTVAFLLTLGCQAVWFRHLRVYGRFVVPVSRDRPVSIAGDVGDRQDGNVL